MINANLVSSSEYQVSRFCNAGCRVWVVV